MDPEKIIHKSRLECLPTELKQLILAAIPDVMSLRSAALCCWSMYQAFMGAEKLITPQVLTSQLNPELLHYALVAHEAAKYTVPWTPETAEAFIRRLLSKSNPMLVPKPSRLSEALPIAGFYNLVQHFVDDFVSAMFSTPFGPANQEQGSWALSSSEVNRIEIAFYRFEIYCKLFKGGTDQDPFAGHLPDQKEIFHKMFPPWENEQLACVHDYLLERVKNGTNDFHYQMQEGIYHGCIAYHLSQGLSYLHTLLSNPLIITTEDYDRPLRSTQLWFLEHSLIDIAARQYFTTESSNIAEVKRAFPHTSDLDTGPIDVWDWARRSRAYRPLVSNERPIPLRKWGYVMWDRARLDGWGVLRTTWGEREAYSVIQVMEIQRAQDKDLIDGIAQELHRERTRLYREQCRRLRRP
ncbi:conserved hypothetical protein [Coccidioides posadasii str. Silveira]|uniref:F-box domain-containing protein n=1 Tax=Coccidioides posadasii (strain RMSCC 757 / Silveira) TaxID=443226 RepID=E9CSR9_COCPS|nr:conserved hypothetical protein [Coccidioides posadasii str. Silveira]